MFRPMSRVAKWSGLALLLVVASSAVLLLLRGRTPAIEGSEPIAELREIDLGGDPQWVLLRGADRANPVVLFLHGGPGMPAMYLAHDFQRAWERRFTIVHWDRLGAGKSYGAGLAHDSFTVRRTLDDTHELAMRLREEFRVASVWLVGHSWGSYLGMLAIAERPDLYAGFVGTGQLSADTAAVRRERAAMLRPLAEAAGDTALLRRLRAGEPLTESDLFRYGGELFGKKSFWPILWTGMRAPEYTAGNVLDVGRGASRVGELMRGAAEPLAVRVHRVEVPVYFFLGCHDLNTPPALAVEYLDRLEAPRKGVVWFERSAHFPFWEESDRFLEALSAVIASDDSPRGVPPPPRGCGPAA